MQGRSELNFEQASNKGGRTEEFTYANPQLAVAVKAAQKVKAQPKGKANRKQVIQRDEDVSGLFVKDETVVSDEEGPAEEEPGATVSLVDRLIRENVD